MCADLFHGGSAVRSEMGAVAVRLMCLFGCSFVRVSVGWVSVVLVPVVRTAGAPGGGLTVSKDLWLSMEDGEKFLSCVHRNFFMPFQTAKIVQSFVTGPTLIEFLRVSSLMI